MDLPCGIAGRDAGATKAVLLHSTGLNAERFTLDGVGRMPVMMMSSQNSSLACAQQCWKLIDVLAGF